MAPLLPGISGGEPSRNFCVADVYLSLEKPFQLRSSHRDSVIETRRAHLRCRSAMSSKHCEFIITSVVRAS